MTNLNRVRPCVPPFLVNATPHIFSTDLDKVFTSCDLKYVVKVLRFTAASWKMESFFYISFFTNFSLITVHISTDLDEISHRSCNLAHIISYGMYCRVLENVVFMSNVNCVRP